MYQEHTRSPVVEHVTLLMMGWKEDPEHSHHYLSPWHTKALIYENGMYAYVHDGVKEGGFSFEQALKINPLEEGRWSGTITGRVPSSPNLQNINFRSPV